MNRICHNCRFFDPLPKQRKQDTILGACKANPPFPPNDNADSKLGVWPLVIDSFWCGIFEEKEEKEKIN